MELGAEMQQRGLEPKGRTYLPADHYYYHFHEAEEALELSAEMQPDEAVELFAEKQQKYPEITPEKGDKAAMVAMELVAEKRPSYIGEAEEALELFAEMQQMSPGPSVDPCTAPSACEKGDKAEVVQPRGRPPDVTTHNRISASEKRPG